jgi:hypothetical protein
VATPRENRAADGQGGTGETPASPCNSNSDDHEAALAELFWQGLLDRHWSAFPADEKRILNIPLSGKKKPGLKDRVSSRCLVA